MAFLLRVTNVKKQPFRSMGFVSVIIVSGLFALGVPALRVDDRPAGSARRGR